PDAFWAVFPLGPAEIGGVAFGALRGLRTARKTALLDQAQWAVATLQRPPPRATRSVTRSTKGDETRVTQYPALKLLPRTPCARSRRAARHSTRCASRHRRVPSQLHSVSPSPAHAEHSIRSSDEIQLDRRTSTAGRDGPRAPARELSDGRRQST